jgi:hypothetical protein
MQLRKHVCVLGVHLLNENTNILKKNSEALLEACKKLCLEINAMNTTFVHVSSPKVWQSLLQH